MSSYKERNKKIFELFFIIALIGVSAYMIYIAQTTGLPGQNNQLSSMAFPKAAYIGIIAMCLYLLVDNVRWLLKHPVDKNSPKAPYVPFKSLVTFVLIVVYAVAWKRIGFTLCTFIFVFVESLLLQKVKSSANSEERQFPLWITAVVAIVAAVLMYVIFGLFFKVNLPDPLMNMIRGI